jgi:urease accessory protein UreF
VRRRIVDKHPISRKLPVFIILSSSSHFDIVMRAYDERVASIEEGSDFGAYRAGDSAQVREHLYMITYEFAESMSAAAVKLSILCRRTDESVIFSLEQVCVDTIAQFTGHISEWYALENTGRHVWITEDCIQASCHGSGRCGSLCSYVPIDC